MVGSQLKETSSDEQLEDEFQQLQRSLPKDKWLNTQLCFYQGFWCPTDLIFKEVTALQNHFQAKDGDILLASLPKTGTTWLKSLLFTIVNRKNLSDIAQNTMCSRNPHELVPHLEYRLHQNNKTEFTEIPSPRLFATHVPYQSLPDSIKTSKCQILYVCRNPLDTFVSLWHFFLQFEKNKGIDPNMEEYLSKYCMGISPFGPHEDHLLGFWKESKKNPQKVLFLEYEGLKKEPKNHLRKLAEFVGCPFFMEEEEEGDVIDKIIDICSLKSLKEMEINKNGQCFPEFENKFLFRKGEVGDWTNSLTPSMAKQFDQMLQKLKDAGFCFTYFPMKV